MLLRLCKVKESNNIIANTYEFVELSDVSPMRINSIYYSDGNELNDYEYIMNDSYQDTFDVDKLHTEHLEINKIYE